MKNNSKKQEFEILDYDPIWKEMFHSEKNQLLTILDKNVISIHHIGSTAIPNTRAKPEIDILIVVKDDSILSRYTKSIEALGYVVRGECLENGGTLGRYYYSKDRNNKRTHKLHICQIGHTEIISKLLFVKYLNAHAHDAIAYAKLKTDLSKKYNYGKCIEKYLEGKSDFILSILDKAKQEYRGILFEELL